MRNKDVAMTSIINNLLIELAKRDYLELESKIKGMNFETALKTFNGFNLRADPITSNKICIGVNMFFECRYKSIQVTIFKSDDKSCELGESCFLGLSVAVVADNEQQAMEIGRKRLDAFTDAEIGQEAQFGNLEIYAL